MAKRNLDHLNYDENLYDFMKSLIPYSISFSNDSVNKYLLLSEGLQKNDILNIYYNDSIGKREFVNEFILHTILPSNWNGDLDEDGIQIDEGLEMTAVVLDVQGSFSIYKFAEKVRGFYDQRQLWKVLLPQEKRGKLEKRTDLIIKEDIGEERVHKNKLAFIEGALSNLFVFPCMDAIELNLTVRSLAEFLKKQKSVGLLVLDGLQFLENLDAQAAHDKRQAMAQSMVEKKKRPVDVAAFAQEDVPMTDSFLESSSGRTNESFQNARKSFMMKKKGTKASSKTDAKMFDSKLIDRSLALLLEYQKQHQFPIIKCQARPHLRKCMELQNEVMNLGIGADQTPHFYEAQLLDQGISKKQEVEGQIFTEDDQLREKIKTLNQGEVLIMRGDKSDSLKPQGGGNPNVGLTSNHLSCIVMPHVGFQEAKPYLKRFIGLYVLYACKGNLYKIHDSVTRAFYL